MKNEFKHDNVRNPTNYLLELNQKFDISENKRTKTETNHIFSPTMLLNFYV